MEGYLSDPIEELRELVRKAKWNLPKPVRMSREAFFDIDNLWKIEIRSTCDQAVEFMGGVVLTINDGLNRPAAALSRSIHECWIRFHYLSDHEDELPDWFRWQMSHDYHATLDTLRKYEAADADDDQTLQRLQENNRAVKDFLGEEPPKRPHPWKGAHIDAAGHNQQLGSGRLWADAPPAHRGSFCLCSYPRDRSA